MMNSAGLAHREGRRCITPGLTTTSWIHRNPGVEEREREIENEGGREGGEVKGVRACRGIDT
jgi:hypothetical protein